MGIMNKTAEDIRKEFNKEFPIEDQCIKSWPTRYRCWWGRYGKCDQPDWGNPRCLSKELSLKTDIGYYERFDNNIEDWSLE
jgi:hypothetical protein